MVRPRPETKFRPEDRRPVGFPAIGALLVFGAAMAALAGTSLIWRGGFLEPMWRLNRDAYQKLAPLGAVVGIAFVLLSGMLAAAGIGWFRRRRWGWVLTVIIIATQLLGGVANFLTRDFIGGATGIIMAGALLWYLLQPAVQAFFRSRVGSKEF